MSIEDEVVMDASLRIAELIRNRAGAGGLSSVGDIKRLCRHGFGIGVRCVALPLDYYGEVRGDIDDAGNATIIVNAAQPVCVQARILLHELVECLAQRGVSGIGETAMGEANACAAPDLRHRVAVAVEILLADEPALASPGSGWPPSELLRLFPLDPKYSRPRTEIEHVACDVVI
jgi:hypothetical protein